MQLTIVTADPLLHSRQHIFNLTSDFLLSLGEVRSEDFVQLFFSEETECQKDGGACSRSTGPCVAEPGPEFSQRHFLRSLQYFLSWESFMCSSQAHIKSQGIRQNPSEMNICILAQKPCGFLSLLPASTFPLKGSPSFTFWQSFLILCSPDVVLLCK